MYYVRASGQRPGSGLPEWQVGHYGHGGRWEGYAAYTDQAAAERHARSLNGADNYSDRLEHLEELHQQTYRELTLRIAALEASREEPLPTEEPALAGRPPIILRGPGGRPSRQPGEWRRDLEHCDRQAADAHVPYDSKPFQRLAAYLERLEAEGERLPTWPEYPRKEQAD